MAAGATRKRSAFSWDEVAPELIRSMLMVAYTENGRDVDPQLAKLRALDAGRLPTTARRVLREPPPANRFSKAMVTCLLDRWLPRAPAATVVALATEVAAGQPPRTRPILTTKAAALTYLTERRRTDTFARTVRRSFLSAHRVVRESTSDPAARAAAAAPLWLQGADGPEVALRPHQQRTALRLDELLEQDPPHGAVVLPTGAGKTHTAVSWLLDRLEEDESARVLWISHQQELLDQTLRTFAVAAAGRPVGFRRKARGIHSRGSAPTTLAEDDLSVAAATVQSLGPLDRAKRARLAAFTGAPTYVVVDEAHHASAPVYQEVLEHVLAVGDVRALLGLTATPWPTGAAARARFDATFPVHVEEAGALELIENGVLAQPVLHTVDTKLSIELGRAEVRAAIASDLTGSALRQLNQTLRNEQVVETWCRASDSWGKTLLFATSIDHADRLADMLAERAVEVRSLHSSTLEPRTSVLEWFRSCSGPAVLVAVGMLNEGVDLPDARTAFLARPTTSPILLRQMIGRVLRGPASGGGAEANVVSFRDHWANLPDVLSPPDVLDVPATRVQAKGDQRPGLPSLLGDDLFRPLPPSVLSEVERVVAQARDAFGEMRLPELSAAQLVGYYRLGGRTVAVFAHQLDGYAALIDAVQRGESLRGTPFERFFEDDPPPYPTPRALRDLVDHVREEGEPPPFVELQASLGPRRAADRVQELGDVSDAHRAAAIASVWEQTLVRAAFPSARAFTEAVNQELDERRQRADRALLDPESPVPESSPGRPPLPRHERDLDPILASTIDKARHVVPLRYHDWLDEPPAILWTSRVATSTWGHWSLTTHGKAIGRQVIRINRLLRTTPGAVPDEALEYLLFHELLHAMLPNQGHDAEFREYESSWPSATELDVFYDTLHERWATDPKKYSD